MRDARGGGLLHPVSLAAIATLVINDHVLKRAFPGFVTGKLSDVAGMVFFPLFLQAAWEVVTRAERSSTRVLAVCAAATAIVFSLVKLVPLATDSYGWALGVMQWPFRAIAARSLVRVVPAALVRDASDLVAVPFVLVSLVMNRVDRASVATNPRFVVTNAK